MKAIAANPKKKPKRRLVAGLIAVFITVICLGGYQVHTFGRMITRESNQFLNGISSQVSATINYRVDATFQSLKIIADAYLQMGDELNKKAFLESMALKNNYKWLGYAGPDGKCVTTSGKTYELGGLGLVERVVKGNAVLATSDNLPIDYPENGFVYAVPVRGGGQSHGALLLHIDNKQIQKFLQIDGFVKQGYCEIIGLDGEFIVKSDYENQLPEAENFFDLVRDRGTVDSDYSVEKMVRDMQRRMSGTLFYRLEDGAHKAMTYTPLKAQGWYLLTVVPTSAVVRSLQRFVWQSIAISSAIALMFLFLILLILHIQKKNKGRLETLAYQDPVTGGFNRVRFEELALEQIRSAPADAFAMVSLDIKEFKLINTSYGSDAGNRVLRHIHDTVLRGLREGELVARVTADTFSILLENALPDDLEARLERIASEINAFNESREEKYFLLFYAGVYQIGAPDMDIITIQDRANVARKTNKGIAANHRKSACAFYSDTDRERMVYEKELGNRMQTAMENGEFRVYLQPKVELTHGRIGGAEALIRWQHPEKGLVFPGDFIPVFERNGFIVNLDLFVFEEICRLQRKWIDGGLTPVPISVNLSRAHLANPCFLEPYQMLCDFYGIPPQLLELELTESLVSENIETFVDVLRQIHEIGFTCSLDDFGSGYSSLNIIKDVPIDIIKLDRAFFLETGENKKRGESVVQCMVELSEKLGMKTVAEGVETPTQVDFLRGISCDMVQGYVFSKAVPIEIFEQMAFCEHTAETANYKF